MNTKRFTVPIAIVLALVITPALSSCFGNPIEQIIEGATGGDVSLPGQGVPDDFPKDVPLIDGDVVFGIGVGDQESKGWNVTIKVAGLDAADNIKSQLEGAGFAQDGSGLGGATEDGATLVYSSEKYSVLVVIAKDSENGFVASYTVAETN